MAVLGPMRFDIVQANPLAAYQMGANVGLGQQRNRMAQLAEQRAQSQEERARRTFDEEMRRYGLQEARAAMTDYALLNQSVAGLPTEQQQGVYAQGLARLRQLHPARNGSDPFDDVPEAFDPAQAAALAPLLPKAPKAPGSYQEYQLAVQGGFPGSYTDFLTTVKRQPGTTINVGGQQAEGTSDRPLTADEAPRFGIDPARATDFVVNAKGEVRARPASVTETEVARAEARREVGEKPLARAIENYRSAAMGAQTIAGFVPPGPQRKGLDTQRQALVALVAKNILGTPGAEPSPALYQQAEGLVPDYSDPVDRANLPTMLDTLEEMMAKSERERGQAEEAPRGPFRTQERSAFPDGVPTEIEGSVVIEYEEDAEGNRFVRTQDGAKYRMVE